MKNYKIVSLFILVFITISCHKKEKSALDYDGARLINQKALDIHDEVMPKMGQMMQLQKSLKEKKDQIKDEELIGKIEISIQELDNAYNGMMTWMRNLVRVPENENIVNQDKIGSETIPLPEEMEKLQSKSLEEIKIVKEKINTSIKKAELLLESLNS